MHANRVGVVKRVSAQQIPLSALMEKPCMTTSCYPQDSSTLSS